LVACENLKRKLSLLTNTPIIKLKQLLHHLEINLYSMTIFSIWAIIILFLILLFQLANLYIRKYFENKKGEFDSNKSNYISYIAITSISAGFLVLNPKSIGFLMNITILSLNKYFNINITTVNNAVTILDIIVYAILCISIVTIIYFSYRHRLLKFQIAYDNQKEKLKEKGKINFPEQEVFESPFLHIRIRELFELKYKRYQLELSETKDETENVVLYGSYQDDFNTIFEIIYCDVKSNTLITDRQVNKVIGQLESLIYNKLSENRPKPIAHYYYITENSNFKISESKYPIKCYSENNFLNSLIDFTRYLKLLESRFANEKLFSAILKEDDKKSLADTFIEPAYFIGENRKRQKNKLLQYVLKWLEENVNEKHLVLLGDYGMGKTSFLKYLASKLAKDINDGHTKIRFPVFISLTNCSPIHGGIYKTLQSFVAEHLGVDFELFKKLIDKGKILFLLDSFDEMGFIGTKEQRFKQFNEIWQLATKNNKIILTGRPSYFPTEFELNQILAIPKEGHEVVQTLPFAEKLTLCKLDEPRILNYIEKYYPEKAKVYFNWIKSNNSLFELCKRPSMMHIIREMLESLYDDKSDVKLSAGSIMKKYLEYWVNRQQSKRIQSAFQGNETKKVEFIHTFFTDLAVEFYLTDKLQMPANDIIDRVNKQIVNWNIPDFDRVEYLEGFQQEIFTGFFIEREDDSYKFVHKSFYEFFVALRITKLLKNGEFSDDLMYKTWNLEIIDFVYDTIPEKYQKNTNVPALLGFSNSKLLASLKLRHFKFEMFLNQLFYYFYKYFLLIYFLTGLVGGLITYKAEKLNHDTKWIFSFSKEQIYFIVFLIISFMVITFIFNKLDKIKEFTTKSIILSISKNEINCTKFIRQILCIRLLTIKLHNQKIKKCYSTFTRRFENSAFEDVTFENCNLQYTYLYDSCLKNVDFGDSQLNSMKFYNCQLENVNFNKIKITKERTFFNMLNPTAILKLFRSSRNKNIKDYILFFANMQPYQFDSKTVNSIKLFISVNKLDLDKDIYVDEELKSLFI